MHGILQGSILVWVAFPSPGDPPDPEIKPMSRALQADSLPSEPPSMPLNAIFTKKPRATALHLLVFSPSETLYLISPVVSNSLTHHDI